MLVGVLAAYDEDGGKGGGKAQQGGGNSNGRMDTAGNGRNIGLDFFNRHNTNLPEVLCKCQTEYQAKYQSCTRE